MSVTPTDFVFPLGKLRPAMVGLATVADLTALVQQYATAGETKAVGAADLDAAVTAYVYWQGFDAAATLLATQPLSTTIEGDVAETFGASQLAYLQRQAESYRLTFLAALPPATSGAPTVSIGTAVPTVVQW